MGTGNERQPLNNLLIRLSGPELKAVRLAAQLEQQPAADLVGVKKRTLQDWEAGVAAVPLAAGTLFLLATGQHRGYSIKHCQTPSGVQLI